MSRYSVRKPLTVFVAVIAVLVLGVVAYLKMTPDLLPNMDFPYIMIMTTYPGASPEKVEQEITKPMEQSMATLEHIKEITSTSAENYSMLLLEFEEAANLDVIGVDIQQHISTLQGGWDALVGVPYVLKINPSMLPVMVAAVSKDGMNTAELSTYLEEELLHKLEGVTGVARISTSGVIRQELHVILDQEKIDKLNGTIADSINGKMDDALSELNKTKQELTDAKAQLAAGKEQMAAGKDALVGQTAAGEAELNYQQTQLINTRAELQSQLAQLQSAKGQLEMLMPVLRGLQELLNQESLLEKELAVLEELERTAADLAKQQAEFDNRIAALESSGKPREEIDAEIALIKESPEYVQLQAQKAELTAKLTLRGLTAETIPQRIATTQKTLDELKVRAEELKKLLAEKGINLDQVDETVAEMESNLQQMEAGMAAITDGIRQIDDGMLQLKDAQKLLSEQKTAGLLEMAGAVTEMQVGEATITNAMTQLEGGIDTLETTREQTLKQADLSKLLTMEMVSNILTAQNFAMPAGTVEENGVKYRVSVGREITTVEELENLLLFDMGMEGLEPIYLKDVAAVMVTDNRNETYAKLNGLDSVVLSFEKQSTFATAETTDNLLTRFKQLEMDDPNLSFVPLMNQGDYIYLIVDTILSSLLLGAVFAILVLFLFLKDLRPTFITLCSIPISVIFAIVLMYFSGVTINMISLSGLAVAVGMLVDNSVVVIENIYRLRAKGANVIQAAVSGAQQVAGAVTASTLTTVCVFIPIVFVEGITRQLFTDLALTMTYALMASLIVALTLVPAMASGMLRKEKKTRDVLLEKVLAAYEKAAAWSLDHKAIILISATVLLVATGAWSLSRGFIFMPKMDMPNVSVTVSMPEEADMEQAVSLADEVLTRIGTLDGIKAAGAMMSSSGATLLGGSGEGLDVTVYITLEDESASGAAVAKEIESLCADMECTVSATSAMLDMSMLSGSGIALEIYCNDMEQLQTAAKTAAQALSGVEGIATVSDGLEDAAPALLINVDRNKAMAQGITVAQVYMELMQALQTSSTGTSLTLEGTNTSVIIEKPQGAALKPEDLESYPFSVTNQLGEEKNFILSDIATVEQTTSLNTISRIDQQRYLTVTASLEEGVNVTKATAEAQRAIKHVQLGKGVTYQFSGENETIMEAVEQMALMLLLGVLLVYLVMVAQFQSLKSPFIVMFTIPLAFTGGFMGLLLCNMEVSVISMVGFVMLTGIIVNNGIVLVDYINQLRLEGVERRAAILEAGRTRMRPILMTTITTVLGLIDMAVRKNAGTTLMQPVAVVCIGGLVYATLMTLFVVPCIYDMVNKKELRSVREEDLKLLDM